MIHGQGIVLAAHSPRRLHVPGLPASGLFSGFAANSLFRDNEAIPEQKK